VTPRFGALVRREAAATWGGRRFWLWVALATALVGVGLLAPLDTAFLDTGAFQALCLVAAWGPVWLGADLLSLRFRGNLDPHREWSPREFAARAVGKLGPFLLVQTLAVLAFTARSVYQPDSETEPRVPTLLAWTLVFQASSLYLFAIAGVLSAAARRPRRLLIAPAVMLAVAVSDGLLGPFPLFGEDLSVWQKLAECLDWLPAVARIPNVGTGVGAGGWFRWGREEMRMLDLCLIASGFFLAGAGLCGLLTWRIAAVRLRRRPGPQADAVQEVAPGGRTRT